VVAISTAIAQHQDRKAAAVEPTITYDNYFQIDDRYLSVPGWSVPLSDIKYATRVQLEGESSLTRLSSAIPVGLLVASFTFKSMLELGDSSFSIMAATFFVLIIMLALLVLGKQRKTKADIIDRLYVANIGTTMDVVPVLISVDKEYVERFVSVVNEEVRKHQKQISRHSKVTVRGST
jgi:hypothetical protein